MGGAGEPRTTLVVLVGQEILLQGVMWVGLQVAAPAKRIGRVSHISSLAQG